MFEELVPRPLGWILVELHQARVEMLRHATDLTQKLPQVSQSYGTACSTSQVSLGQVCLAGMRSVDLFLGSARLALHQFLYASMEHLVSRCGIRSE